MDTMLQTHRPAPALASYVEALWYYDGSQTTPHKERVLPNGRFQIVIGLSTGAGAVSGMRSHSIVIEPAAIPSVIGVIFGRLEPAASLKHPPATSSTRLFRLTTFGARGVPS